MLFAVLRWASVGEALVLAGWAVAVLQEARKFRPPNLYVRLVTASYVLLVATTAISAAIRPHRPRLLVGLSFLALTYGIAAMWAMHRHYRYSARVRRHQAVSEGHAERLRRDGGLEG